MKTIGICRFSYAGMGGFQVEHPDLPAREAFLYDPVRMEERFRLFEAITLPSVAGQTDPDFTFLIVTGDSLPDAYMTRLRALTERIPQTMIRSYPPLPHRKVMKRAINEARGDADTPCLQFRLDDDDAMAVTFVARLKQTALDLRSLWDRHPAIAIDFNKGYVFTAGPEGISVWAYKYQYSAIALGMLVQPGHTDTIMNHGHQNLWKTMPTVTFTDEDMMMRGHNDFNDSRQKARRNVFDYQPLDSGQAAYFKKTFNIDNAVVRRIFSVG
ncbi:hypothetical protein C1J03_03195 [Sulfitobacter sp. SK012]|nr:hypothetical protein C1J03_03195 [Sulfitobacter sp. SK012]